MTNKFFLPEELEWKGLRFVDPIGRVFFLDGNYYRAIYPEKVDYIKSLFKSGVIEKLVNQKLVLPIEYSNFHVKGYGLVLKTKGSTWNIEGHTYTRATLKKSAVNWIKINEILLTYHLGLIDAHLNNIILVEKCKPLWIDLGSIQPLGEIEFGVKQFLSYQLYPLILFESQKKYDRIVRLLIQNGGISDDEFFYLNGFGIKGLLLIIIMRIMVSFRPIYRRIFGVKIIFRKFLLKFLHFLLITIDTNPPKGIWTEYRSDISYDNVLNQIKLNDDLRIQKIFEIIQKIKPQTILDVGANDGFFSILSATLCKKILVTDLDEGAIDKFSRWVDNTSHNNEFCYCIDDFHHIKHQAELVLGLALVHHLSITHLYKFDYIARRFSEMSTKYLLTEFMPNGCGGVKVSPNPLPPHYQLNIFVDELKKHFKTVRQIDYDRSDKFSSRILLLCCKEAE